MKLGRFISLFLISIVFLQMPSTVSSDTGDLVFTIKNLENIHQYTEKSSDGSQKGTRFYFRLTLQIENPTNEIISIQHPNSCGFAIYITYAEHQNWENRGGGIRCFSPDWTQNIDPGLTKINEYSSIFFNGTNIIPDGQYSISIIRSTISNILLSANEFYVSQGVLFIGIADRSLFEESTVDVKIDNNLEQVDGGLITTIDHSMESASYDIASIALFIISSSIGIMTIQGKNPIFNKVLEKLRNILSLAYTSIDSNRPIKVQNINLSIFCPACGTTNPPLSFYCIQCGVSQDVDISISSTNQIS